jgi:hypothetical protein
MQRRMMAMVAALVMALAMVAIPGAAMAEGFFDSSIAGGRVGFQSRRWTDKHLDGNNTTIRFDGCRDSVAANDPTDNVDVHLWRDIPFGFDENRGVRRLNCWNSDTESYGVQPNAGDYYFQIDAITGVAGTSVNVPFVRVTY